MRKFLKTLPGFCFRAWRGLSAVASALYPEAREELLRRTRARTDLDELAVAQKKMELEFQYANNVVDLVQKLEKIKDPEMREKARAAITGGNRSLSTAFGGRGLVPPAGSIGPKRAG
jgi:hypothetical protein